MNRITYRCVLLALIIIAGCKNTTVQLSHRRKLLDVHYAVDSTVKVWEINDTFIVYESGMTIDADGSPRAYNPENTGIDDTMYAFKKKKLSPDIVVYEHGKPYLQKDTDPYPGYYISQTELQFLDSPRTSYRRFVNSEEIPYISIPANLKKKIDDGDIALVYNKRNKKYAYAIVGDTGDDTHIGEASIKTAQSIGIPISFKKYVKCDKCDAGIVYIIIRHTSQLKPLSEHAIDSMGRLLLPASGFMRLVDSL